MANQAWSPVHPSPGFLLKCGKEQEKLRNKLQVQLQNHMKDLFEQSLYADISIESHSLTDESKCVLKAHKAVLIVRVPAFWKELCTSYAVKDETSFSVPLDPEYFTLFLRSVYSDDDIRRLEHDILRMLRSHSASPSGDEEGDASQETTARSEDQEERACSPPSEPQEGGTPSSSQPRDTEDSLENFCSCAGSDEQKHADIPLNSQTDDLTDSLHESNVEDSHNADTTSELREDMSTSMSGSMVRSSTFDLQGQMPLEAALDQWTAEQAVSSNGDEGHNGKEESPKADNTFDGQQHYDSATTMRAFFLHEKSSDPVLVSYQCTVQTSEQERGVWRNVEGDRSQCMGDSGFASQSVSALLQDEAMAYDSLNDPNDVAIADGVSDHQEHAERPAHKRHPSGTMFPIYIDINEAEAEEGKASERRKSSPSSVYMYIDAKECGESIEEASRSSTQTFGGRPKRAESANDDQTRRPQSCYMYVDFNSVSKGDQQDAKEGPEKKEGRGDERVPRTLSLSMFIDINDEHSESVVCAQEAYRNYRIDPGHLRQELVECHSWEHFEQEEILVVSEEYPHEHRAASQLAAEECHVPSPRRIPEQSVRPSDVCLLPMSPILRRKGKQEPPKPAPQMAVKSSTRPQDIDAMTFRRAQLAGQDRDSFDRDDGEELLRGNVVELKISEGKQPESSLASSVEMKSPVAKHRKAQDSSAPVDVVPQQPPSLYEMDDDSETVYSEVSDVSGLSGVERQFQGGRSGAEVPGSCCKLGEDLLQMLIAEIESDVAIQVEGREIHAHRCILATRCEFFQSLFKEAGAEEGNAGVSLEGFTYGAVHFALQHIYSGAATLPKDVHVAEIALLADFLDLGSLRAVVLSHVRMNYCHFFHKPCNQCIAGVAECLQMAPACGLEELQGRAIQWAGKHFLRVWPHRAFASMPEPIQQLCYQAALQGLNAQSCIDMALNCERLSVTMPRVRWAEPVLGLINQLHQECIAVIAQDFDQVLTSDGFLALGKGQSWNITALEDTILSAVELLTPDVACLSYIRLCEVLPDEGTSLETCEWTQNFVDLLHKIQRQCERFLIHNANRVVHCKSWASLSVQLQKKIKDAAVIVFEFEKPIAPPPRLSSLRRKPRKKSGPDVPESPAPSRNAHSFKRSSPRTSGSDTPDAQGVGESSRNDGTDLFLTKSNDEKMRHAAAPHANAEQKSVRVPTMQRTEIMSESLESTKESSSDSGRELTTATRSDKKRTSVNVRTVKAGAQGRARSSFNASGDLGARPKSSTGWTAACSSVPSESATCSSQYLQSLRHVQPKIDTGRSSNLPPRPHGSQVVRVPPFTIKSNVTSPPHDRPARETNNNDNFDDSSSTAGSPEDERASTVIDFVAEIDAESNLVSHCLHEAELLERELSRKLRKQYEQDSTPLYTRPSGVQPVTEGRRRAASASSVTPRDLRSRSTTASRSASVRVEGVSRERSSARVVRGTTAVSRVSARAVVNGRPLSEMRARRGSGIAVAGGKVTSALRR